VLHDLTFLFEPWLLCPAEILPYLVIDPRPHQIKDCTIVAKTNMAARPIVENVFRLAGDVGVLDAADDDEVVAVSDVFVLFTSQTSKPLTKRFQKCSCAS
jgi:hypothetical protein